MVTTVKQHNTRFRLNYAEVLSRPVGAMQDLLKFDQNDLIRLRPDVFVIHKIQC